VSGKKPTSTEHLPKPKRQPAGKTDPNFSKGRAGELLVAAKLLYLGFDVFFPISDRTAVDLIATHRQQTLRVQVKSRWDPLKNKGTHVMLGKWDPSLVDVLIVYLHPALYYVIPVEEIEGGRFNLCFFPYGKSRRRAGQYFEEYLGRWDLLKS
jgi:hypothetical protein